MRIEYWRFLKEDEKIESSDEEFKWWMPGEKIFKLVDSYGFPLELAIMEMESNKMIFDVVGFIKAAKNSKNYQSKERLRILLFSNLICREDEKEYLEKTINLHLDKIYGKENNSNSKRNTI